MADNSVGQRVGHVPDRTCIDQHAATTRQLDRRGQRPGPCELDLERSAETLAHPHERVEVALQQIRGPTLVDPRPRDQPPAGGLQVDVQVGQRGRAAPDEVGSRPPARQLRKMRQIRQRVEDRAHRVVDVDSRQRPDTGRRAGWSPHRAYGHDRNRPGARSLSCRHRRSTAV